jgi:hypothetical protein
MKAAKMNNKIQLRGQALLNAIEACLRQLANEKENYVYNESELSRLVGCSRPTLDKKTEFIDEVLIKIGVEKRIKKDHPLMEHLYTRIDNLEADKEKLKKELVALRVHHVKLYSTLYMNSVDMAVLVKPTVEDESIRRGKCILCNSTIKEIHNFKDNTTIIYMTDHKK